MLLSVLPRSVISLLKGEASPAWYKRTGQNSGIKGLTVKIAGQEQDPEVFLFSTGRGHIPHHSIRQIQPAFKSTSG
jgi:hypothetical protein